MTTATAWRRSSPCSGDQDCVDGLDRVIPGVRSVRVASRARAYASCSSLPATSCGATARWYASCAAGSTRRRRLLPFPATVQTDPPA